MAFLAAVLLAATAVARSAVPRLCQGRPEAGRLELRGMLESQACDCSWANTLTCQGQDNGGCFRTCCGSVTPFETTSLPSTEGIVAHDGGLDMCGTECTCNWANSFVCGNHGGNCCAKFCCGPFQGKEGAVIAQPWTTWTPGPTHTQAQWTTTTLKPELKTCSACTCDCAWTHQWPCMYGHEKNCCGECCCASSNNSSASTGKDRKSTIFCWLVMRPSPSHEPELVKFQRELRAGIFACDGYAVYSNQTIDVGNGTTSIIVDSDLTCTTGGEFKTALNLGIFMAVWKKVVEDNDYSNYDWTVKVDPDSVFFAERLRLAVFEYGSTAGKVYLNNCKFGLHGPIEVFSRDAVQAWGKGRFDCIKRFEKLCSGDCYWGEDMFIDQCLSRELKVRRDSDYTLLVEEHCDAPKGWQKCTDTSIVAYHPFKDVKGWQQCFDAAKKK